MADDRVPGIAQGSLTEWKCETCGLVLFHGAVPTCPKDDVPMVQVE